MYCLGCELGPDTTTWSRLPVGDDAPAGAEGSVPSAVVVSPAGDLEVAGSDGQEPGTEPGAATTGFVEALGGSEPIMVGGTPYGAEALVGCVLAEVVARNVAETGSAPAKFALVHDDDLDPYHVSLLTEAARTAGIGADQLVLVPRSQAAGAGAAGGAAGGAAVAGASGSGGAAGAAAVAAASLPPGIGGAAGVSGAAAAGAGAAGVAAGGAAGAAGAAGVAAAAGTAGAGAAGAAGVAGAAAAEGGLAAGAAGVAGAAGPLGAAGIAGPAGAVAGPAGAGAAGVAGPAGAGAAGVAGPTGAGIAAGAGAEGAAVAAKASVPWIPIAIAGGVAAVILGVVGVAVFAGGGDDTPEAEAQVETVVELVTTVPLSTQAEVEPVPVVTEAVESTVAETVVTETSVAADGVGDLSPFEGTWTLCISEGGVSADITYLISATGPAALQLDFTATGGEGACGTGTLIVNQTTDALTVETVTSEGATSTITGQSDEGPYTMTVEGDTLTVIPPLGGETLVFTRA